MVACKQTSGVRVKAMLVNGVWNTEQTSWRINKAFSEKEKTIKPIQTRYTQFFKNTNTNE
jgi:hypothetical protein